MIYLLVFWGILKLPTTLLAQYDYFNQYCNADDIVNVPIEHTDYLLIDRCFFIVPIGAIEQKTISFPKEQKDKNAVCFVVHTPTRWNYWHFSIRWQVDGKFIHLNNISGTWARTLRSNAKALISKFAIIEECSHKVLPVKDYKISLLKYCFNFISIRILNLVKKKQKQG